MPTPEELIELMLNEYKTKVLSQGFTTSAYMASIDTLETLKSRIDDSKQPWEVRSLKDYESQS